MEMKKSEDVKMKKNPRALANPLSAMTFSWTIPTFIKGWRRDIEETDLPEALREHRSQKLGDRLEKEWAREKETHKNPSLHRILFKIYWKDLLFYGFIILILEGLKLIQPLALGGLIDYFGPGQNSTTESEAYYYAIVITGCSLLNVVLAHPYMMGLLHMGMKIRVAFSSLVYRKTLKLSKTALGDATVGQIVNLLANDVNRFDVATPWIHNLWVAPLETLLLTYIMYQQVGISGVIGVAVILLWIPIQMWCGKKLSVYRLRIALRTDERVRLMNEILSGIQVIKMYTWEKPFTALVAQARKREIRELRFASYIRGIMCSFTVYTSRLTFFINILAYVLLGNYITAQQVFILTSYYNVLRASMTIFFPLGVAQVSEAHISLTRLRKFLFYDEISFINEAKDKNGRIKEVNGISEAELKMSTIELDKNHVGVDINNATAKWIGDASDNTLTDVNLKVYPGQLTAIVGPVGCGKTSVFHAILKELPLQSGLIQVNGIISYASQEPWLFAGNVRQNILFGEDMNEDRYNEVIRVCALERDLTLLPYGDRTLIGDRGVSLSGGQKARINLARAIYKRADIYLLDDPLSAVDTHVGKQLFEECVSNFLRAKTCILITHQLQYLKNVDQIVILDNGVTLAKGTYKELQSTGLDFAKLLDHQDESTRDSVYVDKPETKHKVKNDGDEPKGEKEQKTIGKVGLGVYKEYSSAGGNIFLPFIVVLSFMAAQMLGSFGDYFITYWVNAEQEKGNQNVTMDSNVTTSITRAGEGDLWEFSRETYIYIFSVIIALTVIVTHVRSYIFFSFCMRSSMNLHNIMFSKIVYATMNFFNNNPSGRILNRFSKDMGSIDEILPLTIVDFLQIGLNVVAIIAVVGVVNVWLLLPTFIILVVFYLLRLFFISTSRSVKRLEGMTKSPVFSHIGASMHGLTTIRAFGAQKILKEEFDNHQDLHSSAWYLFNSAARAFALWLDLVCVIYIGIVTFSFLLMGNEKYGGNVGLAITQALTLTGMFQWGIRQWTELENQMTSVERVMEYAKLESESTTEAEKPPPECWAQKGLVEFEDVSLQYSPTLPKVLNNLNFKIEPKEKVGIVGRTGAGKSSLIYALFQLTKTEGKIAIDGIDIKTIPLETLRSKIAIIPQDPVLFSGSLRKNLDPFDEYTDEILWKALEDVELKNVIADLASGLNSKVTEGGSNFSVGQRQLLCLARAIIRNNKILVLDEATANVDPQTDALIQATIRRKFEDCTVLTIAHRLHTVMDSDKVLVMDAGRAVEFGHPHNLLQDKDSIFYKMVLKTGKGTSENLHNVAEKAFHHKQI